MFGELLGWLASLWWVVAAVGFSGLVLVMVGFVRGRVDDCLVDPWEAAGGPAGLVTRDPGPMSRRKGTRNPRPVRRRAHATGGRAG